MKSCDFSLRLDGFVTDPLIRIMMAADHVDPAELDALLRAAARARPAAKPASGEAQLLGHEEHAR